MPRSFFVSAAFAALASPAFGAGCANDGCFRWVCSLGTDVVGKADVENSAVKASNVIGGFSNPYSLCQGFAPNSNTAHPTLPSFVTEACSGDVASRVSSACACIESSSSTSSVVSSATPFSVSSSILSSSSPSTSSSTPTSETITTISTPAPSTTGNACAILSSSSAAQVAAFPSATPQVPAKLAYDCLNSVALDKDGALKLVDGLGPYLSWQSDLQYKKNPPADYFYPAVDVRGDIAQVKANLLAGKYKNEYEFQADLYQPFAKSHDGHFVIYTDLLTKAIEFGHNVPLVSISNSPTGDAPQIYFKNDINYGSASPVAKINGEDAAVAVAKWAYTASLSQDADSAYNSMFYQKSTIAAGLGYGGYWSDYGRMRYIYPGENTTYEFANGTKVIIPNVGNVKGDFTGVTDGPSFYQHFCTPSSSAAATEQAGSMANVEGYPTPVSVTADSYVSCYYLDGEGNEDVVVVSLLSFAPNDRVAFQHVLQQCISDAKAHGKTKVIIDLQGNGGGLILQGYDAFGQFFPHILMEGYSRLPLADGLLTTAQVLSDVIPANFDPNTATVEDIYNYENFFNYRFDLNLTNDNFLTFNDKFDTSANVFEGQPYSALLRWNLSDPLTTVNSTYGVGFEITGRGSRANFTQPFASEDIILLYNGDCASTCVLFSEAMRIQGKVKSVAFGGRPSVSGKIQGIGGIKGAQAISLQYVYDVTLDSMQYATTAAQNATLGQYDEYALKRCAATGVNLRDQILRDNVNDGLPAQYVVEPADCRLYLTKEMVNDVSEIWKATAKATWGGGKCVAGGFSKRSASPSRRIRKKAKMEWDGVTKRMPQMEKRDVVLDTRIDELYNVQQLA